MKFSDYKSLKSGDFILVSTCFGDRAAKYFGSTEAKSYLGYLPKCDVIHYQEIGESLSELQYFRAVNICHDNFLKKFPHKNEMYGILGAHYPHSILRKLSQSEVDEMKEKINQLLGQF